MLTNNKKNKIDNKLILDKSTLLLLNKILDDTQEKERNMIFNYIVMLGLTVFNEAVEKAFNGQLMKLDPKDK